MPQAADDDQHRRSVPTGLAAHLLTAISEISDSYSNLAARREAVVLSLAEFIKAMPASGPGVAADRRRAR